MIEFFAGWDVVPTVNAGKMRAIYQAGLKHQAISVPSEKKPELRVDRGSPNTLGIIQHFFERNRDLFFAMLPWDGHVDFLVINKSGRVIDSSR